MTVEKGARSGWAPRRDLATGIWISKLVEARFGLHEGPKVSNGRILLVDDEERVLFVLGIALRTLGSDYEIVTAPDGIEALKRLHEGDVDLMITDLFMPRLNGIELTEAVRDSGGTTSVIWLTAHGCQERCDEARRLHVFSCLDKPVEIDEIRRVAQEALNERQPELYS
jgi:DNA-binding NtrC family response regulator